MKKLLVLLIGVLILSLILSQFSTELKKGYTEKTERKNSEIYPFYELWIYMGIVVILILGSSTIIKRSRKRKNSEIN